METQNITIQIEDLLSVFKNYTDSKRLKEIKQAVLSVKYPDSLFVDPAVVAEVERQVDELIKEDKALDNASYLTYTKGKYKKRKGKKQPTDATPVDPMYKDYIGRAGECAVMSELLFRGYNANRMMIDNGIDIIAVKDNTYYYIQVKTTTIKNGKIYAHIGLDRFNQYIDAQLRYIIVARYKEKDKGKDIDKNMFFTFTPDEIKKGIFQQHIKQNTDSVSIKIKFHEKSGDPILYDVKEADVLWNMNKFDL